MAQNVRKVQFLVDRAASVLLEKGKLERLTGDAIAMPPVTQISSLREPTIVLSSLIIMNI